MTAFNPDYPTPAALAFRDGFIAGAENCGLQNIPDDILSYSIDRALQSGIDIERAYWAGAMFANIYFRVQMRRGPRGGYGSATEELLSEYERSLV